MSDGVRAFLNSLVDYAGLFPPAALAVQAAVAEYAGHRQEQEAWMLGRFIAPAARLSEIGSAAEIHLSCQSAWPFSILVGGRDDFATALAALPDQAAAIRDFEGAWPGQVVVESLETPLPSAGAGEMATFVPELLTALAAVGLAGREIFLELPAGGDDDQVLVAIAGAVHDYVGGVSGFSRVGAKLRCGGVTAEAFPSCERIAGVIHRSASLGLPLKCTAGLHHPVRHQAVTPAVMMHGFLNVFGAGVLAWARQLDVDQLLACVSETDPQAFTLTAAGFSWRDHQVAAEEIQQIRSGFLCGFGSCSFTEPRADLQALAILPAG